MRTVLLAATSTSWREWLKEHLGTRDLLVLDPADPNWGTPARVTLVRDDKVIGWRFVGTLDVGKNPLGTVAGLVTLLPEASPDLVVLMPKYRPVPIVRQVLTLMAQLVRPDEMLVHAGQGIPPEIWPIGPEWIEAEDEFPTMVQAAQRRARWIELIERCEDHELAIDEVETEGARLGAGDRLLSDVVRDLVPAETFRAETMGPSLFLVTKGELDDHALNRLMNTTHTSRVHVATPLDYSGRLCSFARQNSDDFGMGMIESFDLKTGRIHVRCEAVPPAPVRLLKVGLMRIDGSGVELGDDRPWAV